MPEVIDQQQHDVAAPDETGPAFEQWRAWSDRRKTLESLKRELEDEAALTGPTARQRLDAKLDGKVLRDDRRPMSEIREEIGLIQNELDQLASKKEGLRDAVKREIRAQHSETHDKLVARLKQDLDSLLDRVNTLEHFESQVRKSSAFKPQAGGPWRDWHHEAPISALRDWAGKLDTDDGVE